MASVAEKVASLKEPVNFHSERHNKIFERAVPELDGAFFGGGGKRHLLCACPAGNGCGVVWRWGDVALSGARALVVHPFCYQLSMCPWFYSGCLE